MNKSKGFTMIELMLVVTIIGILASIAIPAFLKHIKKSKTAEVGLNLRKIYDGEIAYYHEDKVSIAGDVIVRRFISAPSTGNATPVFPPLMDKRSGNWDDESWKGLKFGSDSPVQFCYNVAAAGVATASTFDAHAYGDLDGNNVTSLFKRGASIVNGEISGGAGMYSLNDLE